MKLPRGIAPGAGSDPDGRRLSVGSGQVTRGDGVLEEVTAGGGVRSAASEVRNALSDVPAQPASMKTASARYAARVIGTR
jgi:hypothetical protein